MKIGIVKLSNPLEDIASTTVKSIVVTTANNRISARLKEIWILSTLTTPAKRV